MRRVSWVMACSLAGAVAMAVLGSGAGCATSVGFDDEGSGGNPTSTSTTSGGAGGVVGQGGSGGQTGACAIDCSTIATPNCQVAQCNSGTGQCEIVPAPDGGTCDDGVFCTVNDSCVAGNCVGGGQNDCGMNPGACDMLTCDETAQTCSVTPLPDGSACTPADLCQTAATCLFGTCQGTPKDCFFTPVPDDCHVAQCNPMNGMCEPVIGNEGGTCNDPMDLCTVNKTCAMGVCQGGVPKDCSNLTQGCNIGVCDTTTGQCGQMAVMNGGMCDDLDACTTGETCNNGMCNGGTQTTTCVSGDNCCPSTCNETNDLDCANCDWSTAPFPISYMSSNSVGDLTFDDQCNLYFSTDGGEVYRVNRNTSALILLYDFNTQARGIAFNPNDGLLYVSRVDRVFTMTTMGANVTQLPPVIGSYLNGMVFAPAGWGSYGGHLIMARSTGEVVAINPAAASTYTVIGTTTGNISDVEFDNQTLYVAAYSQNAVLTMTPTGSFSTFGSPGCSPDGVAVKENQFVYTACGSSNSLHKLAIPSGTPTLITSSASLNGSWAPAGIIFDGLDNLIVMEEGEFLKVYTP